MKILVCGGRNYGRKWDYVEQRWRLNISEVRYGYRILDQVFQINGAEEYELIHGAATGADSLAAGFARYVRRNPSLFQYTISEKPFPANWKKHKKAAGPIRNREMLSQQPDGVVAFPGGNGTADMIEISRKAGIKVFEVKK